MKRLQFLLLIAAFVPLLAACGPRTLGQAESVRKSKLSSGDSRIVPSATESQSSKQQSIDSADSAKDPKAPPPTCPVTLPPRTPFTPSTPYPPSAPYANQFWFGTEALWTMLPADGIWRALPYDDDGYTQKILWWRQDFDWRAEPEPELTVTGQRLDASAPELTAYEATNGYHPDVESFMLVGVEIPTSGCWQFTGGVNGHELSFVIWVAP